MATKIDRFNSCGLKVDRIRSHEGPPVTYAALYRGSSRLFNDADTLLSWLRWPENYRYGQELKEWLDNPPWLA